jgi:hypothetical protein
MKGNAFGNRKWYQKTKLKSLDATNIKWNGTKRER